MSFENLHKALDDRLSTVASVPSIVKENEEASLTINTSTSGISTPYIRTTVLPAESDLLSIGTTGYSKRHGLYQMSCFFPTGDGFDIPESLVDAIVAKFQRGLTLTEDGTVVRVRQSWREAAVEEGHLYMVPVVVRWEVFVQGS